jgi:hypothetical protein
LSICTAKAIRDLNAISIPAVKKAITGVLVAAVVATTSRDAEKNPDPASKTAAVSLALDTAANATVLADQIAKKAAVDNARKTASNTFEIAKTAELAAFLAYEEESTSCETRKARSE